MGRMHITHIGFPGSEALELPTITGLAITYGKSERRFATVDYRLRRRPTTLPYGRNGVTVVLTPFEYKTRPATMIRAYDYLQHQCCLPVGFKYWNMYSDGTMRHIEAFDACNAG